MEKHPKIESEHTIPAPQPIEAAPSGLDIKKKLPKKALFWSGIGAIVLVVGLLASAIIWYSVELSPVDSKSDELVKVTIPKDSTPNEIGAILKEKKVIRNEQAFAIHTRLSSTQNKLQAGGYRLSPADSTPEIVSHLTSGNTDSFDITFLPGATLKENRAVLIKAGYSTSEIDAALDASYDSPLFEGKPASADLEGYIYGETYKFAADASVSDILQEIFEFYAQVIKDNDLKAKFASHDLSVYQGITLASIIQREAIGGDEAQIAQVFYSRMAEGMTLGSDVTYQYIADKTGVARDPNLDSPYNTRRYAGLPPGPISAPGKAALLAVANPAAGDYLFFLSGDDNVTYYGRTVAEHEANIRDHCKVKCSIL